MQFLRARGFLGVLVVRCRFTIGVLCSISNRISSVAVILCVTAVRPIDTGISEKYYGVRDCRAVLESWDCRRNAKQKEVLGMVCI